MLKLLITSIILSCIFISCDKSDSPTTDNNNNSSSIANASTTINGVQSDLDSAYAVILSNTAQINILNGELELGKISIITISLNNVQISSNTTYSIPNNADIITNQNSMSLNQANGTSVGDIYNNVLCDATFQTNGDYGSPGIVTITNIDSTNKTISGSYSMTLCSSLGYVDIVGTFTNATYL